MKKTLTKKQKAAFLKEEMKTMLINTTEGKMSMYNLCENVGVQTRVEYYNIIEKLLPKKSRTFAEMTKPTEVVHDWGFIFKNGFQIRNVTKAIFQLYPDIHIDCIRERNPDYKLKIKTQELAL